MLELDSSAQLQQAIAEYKKFKAEEQLMTEMGRVDFLPSLITETALPSQRAFNLDDASGLANTIRKQKERQEATLEAVATGDVLWYGAAKCGDAKVDDYYPEGLREKALKSVARKACEGCFVKYQCLEDELANGRNNQWGIRGGLTARERRAILDKAAKISDVA